MIRNLIHTNCSLGPPGLDSTHQRIPPCRQTAGPPAEVGSPLTPEKHTQTTHTQVNWEQDSLHSGVTLLKDTPADHPDGKAAKCVVATPEINEIAAERFWVQTLRSAVCL